MFDTVSDGVKSAPADEMVVVALPPNAAVIAERLVVDALVVVLFVAVNPASNERRVVVALPGNK